MQMTDFCDHLYDDSTDGYIQIIKLNNKDNTGERTIKIYNTKNDGLEYSMYDLREQDLNYKPKLHQVQMQEAKKIDTRVVSNRFFNSYSLHMKRANDLQTLCKLRKYDMTGFRNMVIHCFAYWKGIYVRDSYELENIVMELNNAFTDPLKETEVNAILRCIPKAIDKFIAYEQGRRSGECKRVSKGMRDKEGYWYKNDTLIERLEISKGEQKHLKTIIDTEEKYDRKNEKRRNNRRNEEGLTNRELEKLEKEKQIKKLILESKNMSQIAKELGVNRSTISRHYKHLFNK